MEMIRSVKGVSMFPRIVAICSRALISVFLIGVVLGAPKTISIQPQVRPFLELAERLQKDYGWRITYEEAPLEYGGDQSALAVSPRIKSARPTPLVVSFEEPKDVTSIPEKHRIMQDLARQYSGPPERGVLGKGFASRYIGPQTMTILSNGDYTHIIPTMIKDSQGNVVAYEPLLSTRVSLIPAQRNLFETVSMVLSQISQIRNVSLVLGNAPTNLFLQTQQVTEANNEEARDVLTRIFEDAAGARKTAGFSEIRLTWALMCDPGFHGCFLNVRFVDPAPDTAPRSPPKRGDKWGQTDHFLIFWE